MVLTSKDLSKGIQEPARLNFLGLTAVMHRTKFEVFEGDKVLETIDIPKKLLLVFNDESYRTLVVLDYLERVKKASGVEESKEFDGPEFLKKFAVEMNRSLNGILTLNSLEDTKMNLSGIALEIVKLGERTHLAVNAGDVQRYFPVDIEMSTQLLRPVFFAAAVKTNKTEKPCCGGSKKTQ